MRRRRKPVSHLSHERWLVSYADFITLLNIIAATPGAQTLRYSDTMTPDSIARGRAGRPLLLIRISAPPGRDYSPPAAPLLSPPPASLALIQATVSPLATGRLDFSSMVWQPTSSTGMSSLSLKW